MTLLPASQRDDMTVGGASAPDNMVGHNLHRPQTLDYAIALEDVPASGIQPITSGYHSAHHVTVSP